MSSTSPLEECYHTLSCLHLVTSSPTRLKEIAEESAPPAANGDKRSLTSIFSSTGWGCSEALEEETPNERMVGCPRKEMEHS